ncbi:hypothetical protein [Georgenia wangjunii]|uniref:hypothetical protein n=1 Tax=Georgenia wangjunii TaxID=3117730 RepID=UPI002F263072
MRSTALALAAAALLALSACAAEDEPSAPETVSSTVAADDQEEVNAPPVTSAQVEETEEPEPEPADEVTIEEVGIGQDGEYAWAAALVNTSGHLGEFITVHFNVFDEADELIASGEQVEHITGEQSTLAIGTQISVGEARAARIDATYAVSDHAMPTEPLPEIEPAPVTLEEYGNMQVRLTNDTSEPWENVRIGIICRNADGAIVGGGHAYPDLVPANTESMANGSGITADSVDECTAYPQHSEW